MAPPDLKKTVDIVQESWQKIVRKQRLKLAISLVKIGELQLAPRFDARRAPWQAPVVAGDASTPPKQRVSKTATAARDARDAAVRRRAAQVKDHHFLPAAASARGHDGRDGRAPPRRSTPA